MTTDERADEQEVPCPWCDAPMEALDWSSHHTPKCAACGREPIVCEKYRIVRLLGRGGMGVVYGAKSVDKHKVAVKIIAPPKDHDWTAWELFERSSRVLQQLHHPRLPKVHAFERTDTGRLVLVREAFNGGTLQQRIAEADAHVPEERVRALLVEMLELLEYLQGLVPPVIHRDIKPSNVMFRTMGDWSPVLVDFDTVVSRNSGLTIVGTPGYAAPEQFAADASPASDVYGLGATMLFVATHTDADDLPRERGRFELDGLLPSLDPELVDVLQRMVEPDVSERYASAREVLGDLEAANPPGKAPAPEPPKQAPPAPEPSKQATPAPAPPWSVPRPSPVWFLVVPLALAWWYGAPWLWLQHATSGTASLDLAAPQDGSQNANDERACERGDKEACFSAALRYDYGTDGVTEDYARSAQLYDLACKRGHPQACNNLGVAYEHGYGVDADVPRAAKLYQGACDVKNGRSCRNLAMLYQGEGGDGVPRDLVKAFGLLTRGCDLRDGTSCNDLGWAFEAGLGTAKDPKRAANLYGQACDLGYLRGCRNSGVAYETADGVERDDQRAVVLFERACGDDQKIGCLELGRMTLEGRGTEKDPARAAESFQKGCDDGYLEACEELGRLYSTGLGVEKDAAKARRLYGRACDGGVADSCGALRLLGK